MAKFNAAKLKQLAKSIKLPTAEQLKTPKGRIYSVSALVAVSALIVGLSTLSPAGSNSPNGNRPGSGSLRGNSSESPGEQRQDNGDQPDPGRSERPVIGPQVSPNPSEQAETEQQRLEREEQRRINQLSAADTFLVTLHISLENLIKASDLALSQGSTSYSDAAKAVKAKSQNLLDELEKVGNKRQVVWAKYGLEPDKENTHRWNVSPLFKSSSVEILSSSSDVDFELNFRSRVSNALDDLVRFAAGNDMPSEAEFTGIKKLIATDFAPIVKILELKD